MQRISVLLFLFVFSFATAMQAQAPAPKPDPEMKKLTVLVGRWAIEGELKPGPLGPGGKVTGERNCQMILGGFFRECRSTVNAPGGEIRMLEITGYDPVNKDFSSEAYQDNGTRYSGALTVAGNTWTFAGKLVTAGKQYQFRATLVFAPDLASASYKTEVSVDGETWTPRGESTWTKVPPAAKK